MMIDEDIWERRLAISTRLTDYSLEDDDNYGYDPTPYAVLERLVGLDILKKEDTVVDYGCGKGRTAFFIADQVGCSVVGVDFSEKLLEDALRNLESFGSGDIVFVNSRAEDYEVRNENIFYFFNPFSSAVFRRVLENIEKSYVRNPRRILIFFYYSTIEYRLYLPTEPRLEKIESLDFTAEETDNDVPAKLDVFRFKPLEVRL